jgi:hypothetical protein
LRRVEFRKQFGHDGLAVEALALPQGCKALGNFCVYLVFGEPAPFRQIALDRFADELARRAVLFLRRRFDFGQQARRDKGVGDGLGLAICRLESRR